MLSQKQQDKDNMKYKNMNTNEILELIFIEKDLAPTTQNGYRRSVQYFEKITGQSLNEILTIAEKEHYWKTSNLRKCLIIYRKELYKQYKKGTAQDYYSKIIAILNHFEIDYGKLPKMKKHNENLLRDTSEIPSQTTLKKCIELKNNIIIKSSTLLTCSTGLSPVDLLNLTLQDYLTATSEYQNYNKHHNILKAIYEMDDKKVIATFKGNRQKTGTEYVTFTSPEAIVAINIYLLSREDELRPSSKLFKISRRQLNKYYQDINEQLGLGVTSEGIAKYSLKNLRSYHATQLEIAGMSDSRIDILQGRKPSTIIRKHYIRINTDTLKQEYIKCLPYIVVDDMEKIKTELDTVKEEKELLVNEINERKAKEDELNKRMLNIEKRLARIDEMDDDDLIWSMSQKD